MKKIIFIILFLLWIGQVNADITYNNPTWTDIGYNWYNIYATTNVNSMLIDTINQYCIDRGNTGYLSYDINWDNWINYWPIIYYYNGQWITDVNYTRPINYIICDTINEINAISIINSFFNTIIIGVGTLLSSGIGNIIVIILCFLVLWILIFYIKKILWKK